MRRGVGRRLLAILLVSVPVAACGSVTQSISMVLADDVLPSLPAPVLSTYILDLSGSTDAVAQLAALNPGVQAALEGDALGNPFAKPAVPPQSLSMQFITLNSGQAPRFRLVSAAASVSLYEYMKSESPNFEQAKLLWDGFVNARQQVFRDGAYASPQTCVSAALNAFGKQSLDQDALRRPAEIICEDASQTATAVEGMRLFASRPSVRLGSDVFGAVSLAINNSLSARNEFTGASVHIVIASDLVDENPSRNLRGKLASQAEQACDLGQTFSRKDIPDGLSDFSFTLVGVSNTKGFDLSFLEHMREFWKCYFEQSGARVSEQTDLSGF